MLCDNCQKNGTCPMQSMVRSSGLNHFRCNHYQQMIQLEFPRKPGTDSGEVEVIDITDEKDSKRTFDSIELNGNKFESFMDMCKYITELEKKIRRYEEMIGSMLAAGQMITQHKEQFDKLRGVE